jgi:hypothetical protein
MYVQFLNLEQPSPLGKSLKAHEVNFNVGRGFGLGGVL